MSKITLTSVNCSQEGLKKYYDPIRSSLNQAWPWLGTAQIDALAKVCSEDAVVRESTGFRMGNTDYISSHCVGPGAGGKYWHHFFVSATGKVKLYLPDLHYYLLCELGKRNKKNIVTQELLDLTNKLEQDFIWGGNSWNADTCYFAGDPFLSLFPGDDFIQIPKDLYEACKGI